MVRGDVDVLQPHTASEQGAADFLQAVRECEGFQAVAAVDGLGSQVGNVASDLQFFQNAAE